MKKMKIALLMLLATVLVLPSCKKGENDPFISLKSRDAKITAKWKLTKIAYTSTSVTSGTSFTTTISYDGSVETYTSGTISGTATGTYEMTIEKDGKMSVSETYTSGGSTDVYTSTGTWEWLNSDQNKTVILLDGGNNLFQGGLWVIDRLSSKELVLTDVGNSNDNGDTNTWDKKYTFEKQ